MKTCICVASGPSLSIEQARLINSSQHFKIAVNNTWQRIIRANIIYAGDFGWWRFNKDNISINAEFWTCSKTAANTFNLNLHAATGGFNSGMRAAQLAIKMGYEKIILVGFDCCVRKGAHWHGRHSKTSNPTKVSVAKWQRQFQILESEAKSKDVEIINCSAHTELKVFRRGNLEDHI